MITGFALGLIRMAIDTPVKLMDNFSYVEGSFFWIMNNMFFQYYSLVIFLVCVAVMVIVSYMSEEPAYEKISGLTYGTLTEEDKKTTRASWEARDVILSIGVLVLILAAYLFFTG